MYCGLPLIISRLKKMHRNKNRWENIITSLAPFYNYDYALYVLIKFLSKTKQTYIKNNYYPDPHYSEGLDPRHTGTN